mmetsp:Transcript_25906/g.81118  ORF Transcript_25906/g.81118 Transcript_25906/m.81118 type:complete len:323 (-) Transcript_25906:198-1166(-)
MWDQVALDRIETATNPERTAEIGALVMQPGLAHLCLVKGQMTILKARVEVNIPRKRAGASANAKAHNKFFDACYQAISRHIDFGVIKVLLVAGPGFVADDFVAYVVNHATRHDDRSVLENRSKMLVAKASSGHKRAVEEVLSDPKVLSQLNDVHAAAEMRVLDDFFAMLRNDASRAFYGYGHVAMATENAAVDKLLITDALFRAADPRERRKYVDLVEGVRESRGEVHLFSSLHVSGEQLGQITGVAAILRFPLPDLEDMAVDDSSDDEDGTAESKLQSAEDMLGADTAGGLYDPDAEEAAAARRAADDDAVAREMRDNLQL